MHLETIDKSMLALSKKLDFLQKFFFYLAGGTGLALQIGHRKSFDMDFFTSKEFIPEKLSMNIKAQKINYPAASGRGINCGHSRDMLIGNPVFFIKKFPAYCLQGRCLDTRFRGYDERGKPRGINPKNRK